MSKNELHPGGVEHLARALLEGALEDYVNGELNVKAEAERFLRSDLVMLMALAYDFCPEYVIEQAEEIRKERIKSGEKYTVCAVRRPKIRRKHETN